MTACHQLREASEGARVCGSLERGNYWFETAAGREFVVIICPRCGKPDRCVNHTIVQRSPLTIRASFLCHQIIPDGSREVCALHGWVTDGVLTEC